MPPKGNGSGDDERRITYFATTHTRGKREMFGIRAIDRGKHMYVIGKTGMGKSTMLENLAIQDIQNGEGIMFIDPHGSTAEKLLDFVPHERIKDVLYFAPFDTDHPIGFNVMEDVGYDKRHLVVSGLMGAFKRIWVDAWSARMEYILQNVLLALLEYPETTLLDVNRMLTNKPFRAAVVEKITDPVVRSFWTEEFATYTDRYTQEATPAIQNKVGQFVSNPLIRNIVGQAKSSFDLRDMMDTKKIVIVNLSKGRMGESNAALLGSMLTVKIYLAAMSRADESAARMRVLPRCYFYVDEFQSMMNEAFADILSESRKYKLALTLANQYIEQMEENVRNAVFGNVGTMITFRVGPFDAEVLKVIYEPTFFPEDLVNLGIGQIYLTLMIDGVGSPPFSAETIPPIETPAISYRDDVIRATREKYGRTREDVAAMIAKRQQDFAPPPAAPKAPRDDRRPSGGSSGGSSSGGPRDRQYDAPRRDVPRQAAPSPRTEQPRPAPAPTPAHTFTPAVERARIEPREERVEKGDDERQRSSLRDAILSARHISKQGETRSPAEILRARLQSKPPQAEPRVAPTPQPARPPRPRVEPAAEESAPAAPPRPRRDEEISTDALRKILNG